MNREHKFRAWDRDNKVMIYSDDKEYCFFVSATGKITVFKTDGGIMIELNTDPAQEYTGLHDKNSKEIYEGDILKAYPNNSEYIGKVYYEDAQWFGACDYLNYAVAYSGAEVIGNIYENPELLEGHQ